MLNYQRVQALVTKNTKVQGAFKRRFMVLKDHQWSLFHNSYHHIVSMVITLWLCQNSYWKWPFIVDLPIKHGDLPIKHGDFPIKNGDLPIKNGDFPMKHGDFP